MEKIVIIRGPAINAVDEAVLTECLRIMFPECEVQVRPRWKADSFTDEAGQETQPAGIG